MILPIIEIKMWKACRDYCFNACGQTPKQDKTVICIRQQKHTGLHADEYNNMWRGKK